MKILNTTRQSANQRLKHHQARKGLNTKPTGRLAKHPVWQTLQLVIRQTKLPQPVQSRERRRPDGLQRVVLQPERRQVTKVGEDILWNKVDVIVLQAERGQAADEVERLQIKSNFNPLTPKCHF